MSGKDYGFILKIFCSNISILFLHYNDLQQHVRICSTAIAEATIFNSEVKDMIQKN